MYMDGSELPLTGSDLSISSPSTEQEIEDDEYTSLTRENVRKPEGLPRKQRKGRTRLMFTRAQSRELEEIYSSDQYPKIRLRRRIAEQMNITERRVQIWFQNRRAKSKREGKLINPVCSMKDVCPVPHHNTRYSSPMTLSSPSPLNDSDKENSYTTEQVSPSSLLPTPFHLLEPEFDPGYPDVGNDPVTNQPTTPLHATSLQTFPIEPTNVAITKQIPYFSPPVPQPSQNTTLDYSYKPLWSQETVVNAKELEELLVTLLSSHMPKTLHATDGKRLESFKGFATSQCHLLHQKDAEYQAMLCTL